MRTVMITQPCAHHMLPSSSPVISSNYGPARPQVNSKRQPEDGLTAHPLGAQQCPSATYACRPEWMASELPGGWPADYPLRAQLQQKCQEDPDVFPDRSPIM